jgi:hypothetical protein
MKNLNVIKNILSLLVLVALMPGCVIEPINFDRSVEIKGAPDWVNQGSGLVNGDGRLFHGVSSANPQGDMALQKSVADDKSMAEVARVLSSYLDVVSNEYMLNTTRTRGNGTGDEIPSRQLDEISARQVKESISRQIDEAISRQFKESISPQVKEEISRQIKKDASRSIHEAISNNIDLSRELEEIISQQIKEAVSRQIKSTNKASMASAKIIGNWRDPRTNTIWSHSVLELKHVKSAIAGVNDLNVDLKRYFEESSDSVFDRVLQGRDEENSFLFR